MPKTKPQPKKLPGKNPTDPMQLARSVVEAATGEKLTNNGKWMNKKKPRTKRKAVR